MYRTNPMRWRDVRIQTPPAHLIAEHPDAPFPVDRAEQRYQELQRSSVLAIAEMARKRDFWRMMAIAGWLAAIAIVAC